MTASGMNESQPSGGRGRLADVIATRGGLAAPEAPFVIEHREALIYMLCEAAELEHGIMCQYLFAAFSLKQSADEGLSESQVAAVRGWRTHISHVAVQEMLHLALVHNLLTAIGAAPHMARPNLPAPASHYPAGVQLTLLPFGEKALRHFMFLERPESWDLDDADGIVAIERAAPVISERDIVPQGQDFATVGHLYRSIEAGFEHLVEMHGEGWLFVGPPRAQATQADFGWPELVEVTDLASAKRAIEEILEQGEGARTGDWRDAHFGQFVAILDEYQQMSQDNPGFDPVRPVMAANVRTPERDATVPLITERATARVADLFNVSYEILLQMFERYFAHTEETDGQLKVLAEATIALMLRVIKPIGDLITRLPVGAEHPGKTTGPSFELFYESDYLMPHREAAWALLAERLDVASWLCEEIQLGPGSAVAAELTPVLNAMREISSTLAAHLPSRSAHAKLAAPVAHLSADELAALLRQADDLAAVSSSRRGTANPLAGLADFVYAIIGEAGATRGCDLTQQALIVPRLVNSVLWPLANVLGSQPPGAGDPADEPSATPAKGDPAARVWDAAVAATKLRLGLAAECPAELMEAQAALQDLACRLVPEAEAERRRDALWEMQSGLPAGIVLEPNGPYLVTNVARLIDHLGARSRPAPSIALCRCGRSDSKPLCDGSHSKGFSDAKDARRVPDRRDVYQGHQVTIFDNRGICQHSGLCTDRLAAVFRTNAAPFVAPSGGRLDEIIRAVRDCPSGALSYALDDSEARDQVDWGGTREPAIEITQDGPYRVTGALPLNQAEDGGEPDRAQGSSREHYALCRCGQSQNKPFCSGMHWYVGFRDPVSPAGYEPTLFEWAGGLPALTRTARFLYETHIPADPLLAPVFADIAADQSRRLAAWLAAALGQAGDPDADPRTATGVPSAGLTDQQRQRWVTLAATAADDAKLPADPGFRSALSSCLEWVSREAAAPADSAGTAPAAVPRWDWGPGGPPPATAEAESEPGQADLPGPDDDVGFAAHIKSLFRERDRQSMSFAFDLWSLDDVRTHAADILRRLQDGTMPCDGAWSKDMVDVFRRWTETGTRP